MNPARLKILTLVTPEGISFSRPLAGPVVRAIAWFADGVIKLGALLAIVKVIQVLKFLSPGVFQAVGLMAGFLIFTGYGILLEWTMRGQTVGKRLFGLRVAGVEGLQLTFSQIAIRNLLRAVDALPLCYLVGGVACFLSRNAQRLGDIAAGTVVVRIPRHALPDAEKILGGKFNSLKQHPHLSGRLRQLVSPEEAELALRACLRREALEPEKRLELFERLAEHFQGLVPFPREATDGLTPEQFVRNVVGILFEARAVWRRTG